jgi:hypothetical protein
VDPQHGVNDTEVRDKKCCNIKAASLLLSVVGQGW